MRFFRHGVAGSEKPGVFDSHGRRRDLGSVAPDLSGAALDPAALRAIGRLNLSDLPEVSEDERLGPCVAGVRNFIAVGLNYIDHAEESGMAVPAEPILFNKAPSCIVGANDAVELPPGSTRTDWEVELAVVIGREGRYLDIDAVDDVISGYCICNDLSERSYQLERGGGQWTKGKGCPTFGPLGPWLVTPDEIADVQALTLWLDVNGLRMQSGSTSKMIFGVRELVRHISNFMILRPGDVITTGTPPGVGLGRTPPLYLKAGDEIRLGIERLGEQRQTVVAYGAGA